MAAIENYSESRRENSRQAGFLQGCILASTSWVGVAAATLIAPVLPRMAAYFASTPDAEALTTVCIAVPSLFVALLAMPFGLLADRVSRRWLLIAALILYSLFGLMPVGLDSLYGVIFSRVGVGVAEAAILTLSTTLIADYFTGAARDRWFAAQSGSAALVAIVFLMVGGALGEISWRAPFLVYSIPIGLAFMIYAAIWDPERAAASKNVSLAMNDAMPWAHLIRTCTVTIFASMAFYVVIIQLPFILSERGYDAPASIGFASAIAATSAPLGSLAFGSLLHNTSAAFKLVISFTLSAIGFLIIASTRGYGETIAGAAVNGFGCGIVLPTVLTWTLSKVPAARRGQGSGFWTSCFSLGQFLSPIVFVAWTNIAGSRSATLSYWGITLALAACFAAISCFPLRKPQYPVKA